MDFKIYLKETKEEQKAFSEVLTHYFERGKYKNPRILNFLCGTANDEPFLMHYFHGTTRLISLDNCKHSERFAKKLKRKSFRRGDLLELKLQGKFDLIIGRNIPLNSNGHSPEQDYWPKVFNNFTNYMKKNAKLFLTLTKEEEFLRAKKILEGLNYKIIVKEKNKIRVPNSFIKTPEADPKDYYVLIAEAPEKLSS